MKANEQQLKIINTPKGKIAVIAGPGTGKSTTTIELVQKLHLVDKIPLGKIFLATFTNKAGEDIKRKLQNKFKLEQNQVDLLWVGTFHSLGYRYLREVRKLTLKILTPSESKVIFKNICEQLDLEIVDLGDLLTAIEKKRSLGCPWDDLKNVDGKLCERVYEEYQKNKQKQNLVDFTDILEIFIEHLKKDEEFPKRFDWIMQDECQDASHHFYTIMDLLTVSNCVYVGDEKQSIFGFRGACPHLFNAKIAEMDHNFLLSYNYRSTDQIINFANLLMLQAPQFAGQELKGKGTIGEKPKFITCRNQAQEIFKNIMKDISNGIPYNEIAVLSRSVKYAYVNELVVSLRNNRIPYVVRGGLDMLDVSYVQDFLSILKTIVSPTNVSLINTFSLLPWVGGKTSQKLAEIAEQNGFEGLKGINAKYAQTKAFKDLLGIKYLKGTKEILNGAMIFYLEHYLNPKYKKDAFDKKEIIKNLVYKDLESYSDLSEGIDQLYLSKGDEEDKNRLVISTIHRSKGLEWESAHLGNCYEFSLPFINKEEEIDVLRLEEEFCLFYVACTRAKKNLRFYMQYETQRGAKSYPNKISRYLLEILRSTGEQFFNVQCLDVFDEASFKKQLINKVDLNGR